MRRCLGRESSVNASSAMDSSMSQFSHSQLKETGNGQKESVASLFEQGASWLVYNRIFISLMCVTSVFFFFFLTVGLQKILSFLESDDPNVRIHAVKVLANLAAEGCCYPLLKTVI